MKQKVDTKNNIYPFATIALYGPDDKRTTKIAIAVFTDKSKEPTILKRWVSSNFSTDEVVKKQIKEFLLHHKVKETIMTQGNIGCIHEEGIDYPIGQDCPFCPFWKERGKVKNER